MAEYRVEALVNDRFEAYVEANSREEAEEKAWRMHLNGELAFTNRRTKLDLVAEEVE